ncbi:hypothetical protein WA026_001655 [Henosepilachna vigintioctopunctata]|uniref:Uncharacterized protein n=1 Tax=Henosepilachna vigintioctopunctata TaxID=420089 RepID=A0AAW1ULT6_9CUCU
MKAFRFFLAFAKTSSNVAGLNEMVRTTRIMNLRDQKVRTAHVPDPSNDHALEELEPYIIFPEEDSIFLLLHLEEDSNVEEQKGVADENEKMMAPPAKKNQAS